MRTKGLREFKQGLVSYKEEYKGFLNYKQWKFNILNRGGNMTAGMGKGNYSYGLLSLNLAFVVLMLAVVDYCWLLMVATGCWMIVSCGWDTACRRKSLWIFLGCWWLAAKTILQAKKSESFRRGDEEIWLRQVLKLSWIISKRRWGNLARTSSKIVL